MFRERHHLQVEIDVSGCNGGQFAGPGAGQPEAEQERLEGTTGGRVQTVELFLAAQRLGILVMSWDLLCPRCRGAKSTVKHLHDLPEGAHCSSCNIDYRRDFTRNVELTFHPEPWLRPLPKGEP